MPVRCRHTPLYIFPCKPSFGIPLLQPFHTPFQPLFVLRPQLLYHLACIRQIKVPAEIINAVPQRENLRLFVQFQFKYIIAQFLYFTQAFPQILYFTIRPYAKIRLDSLWFSCRAYASFSIALMASKSVGLCRAPIFYHTALSVARAFHPRGASSLA